MRLNPHLHAVLDGTYHEQSAELLWQPFGHLKTSEVGQVLERTVRRIDKHLRRRGLLEGSSDVIANSNRAFVLPTRAPRLCRSRFCAETIIRMQAPMCNAGASEIVGGELYSGDAYAGDCYSGELYLGDAYAGDMYAGDSVAYGDLPLCPCPATEPDLTNGMGRSGLQGCDRQGDRSFPPPREP